MVCFLVAGGFRFFRTRQIVADCSAIMSSTHRRSKADSEEVTLYGTDILIVASLHILVFTTAYLVFNICSSVLLRLIRGRKSEALLFGKAGIFLRYGYGEPNIRIKYVLPWVPNPDLSDCPRSAYPLLVAARLSAGLALASSLSAAVFGWFLR